MTGLSRRHSPTFSKEIGTACLSTDGGPCPAVASAGTGRSRLNLLVSPTPPPVSHASSNRRLQGYKASNALSAVDFFAADAVLEVRTRGRSGLPLVYRGLEESRGLFFIHSRAVPRWRLKHPEIHIATDEKVFAEFFIDEPRSTPGRRFSQHIFALMVVRQGKIVRLRETLDLAASARAFLTNGVPDILA